MGKFFVLVASAAAAATCVAGDDAALKKLMDQKCQEFVKAIKGRDASWLKNNATKDFVSIETKGKKEDLDSTLRDMQQMFTAVPKFTEVTSKVLSFKKQGTTLVVVTFSKLVGEFTNPKTNKPSKLVDSSKDEETWVLVGKDYKLKQLKGLTESASIDGKAISG